MQRQTRRSPASQVADAPVVEAQHVLPAHDGDHRRLRVDGGERLPDVAGRDLALDDVEPGADGEQVLEHLDDPRAVHGMAEQPPRGARGDHDGVGAALLQQVRVLALAHRRDDPRGRVELARGERDQHRGVVAVGRDDDGGGLADPRRLERGLRAGVGHDAREPAALRLLDDVGALVDDDDLARLAVRREQRGDRRLALDAVAADDDVVAQGLPPELLAVVGAGAVGEHLERGRDQDDEEQHARGHDDEDVDQLRAVRHRRDVAVARRGDGDGAEVQRVQRAEGLAGAVAEPVPVEVGDDGDEQRRAAPPCRGG